MAKDDAAEIKWLSIDSVDYEKLGFDHRHILSDYKRWKKFGGTFWSSKSKSIVYTTLSTESYCSFNGPKDREIAN